LRCNSLTGKVSELHRNYHIPISNTAAATMLLENAEVDEKRATAEPSRELISA